MNSAVVGWGKKEPAWRQTGADDADVLGLYVVWRIDADYFGVGKERIALKWDVVKRNLPGGRQARMTLMYWVCILVSG